MYIYNPWQNNFERRISMSLKSERQRQHKQKVEEWKRRKRRRQRFLENQENQKNQEYVLIHVFDPQTGYYRSKYITKKEKESLILVYVR